MNETLKILKVKCVTILVSCAEIRISKTFVGYPNKFIGGEAEFSAATLLNWISVSNLQRNTLHFKILIRNYSNIYIYFLLFSFPLYQHLPKTLFDQTVKSVIKCNFIPYLYKWMPLADLYMPCSTSQQTHFWIYRIFKLTFHPM